MLLKQREVSGDGFISSSIHIVHCKRPRTQTRSRWTRREVPSCRGGMHPCWPLLSFLPPLSYGLNAHSFRSHSVYVRVHVFQS
jgi:hypothetical protein